MIARLILFTRFPRPGSVKSRLTPTLGREGAASLYRELTEHTLRRVDQSLTSAGLAAGSSGSVGFDMQIRFTGSSPQEMSDWLGAHRSYAPQGDGGLGARMEAAVQDAFAESMDRVVVIGADCPDLTPEILRRAFDLLLRSDVVIGPALDGGYYLVGVRRSAWERCRTPLFSNMPWGTDEVLAKTLRRAQSAGLDLAQLQALGDVDRPEDLIVWERAREKKH